MLCLNIVWWELLPHDRARLRDSSVAPGFDTHYTCLQVALPDVIQYPMTVRDRVCILLMYLFLDVFDFCC